MTKELPPELKLDYKSALSLVLGTFQLLHNTEDEAEMRRFEAAVLTYVVAHMVAPSIGHDGEPEAALEIINNLVLQTVHLTRIKTLLNNEPMSLADVRDLVYELVGGVI